MTSKPYYTILHKDKDSAYGAYIPDLPGCFAAGDTEDEAIDNLRVSLRMYAEDAMEAGQSLPVPRSLEELRADSEVHSVIQDDGGVFVMIPLLVAGKKRRVNVTLDPSLIAAIDEAARISGSSRSDYLATAAWRAIKASTRAVRAKPPTRKALPDYPSTYVKSLQVLDLSKESRGRPAPDVSRFLSLITMS